MNMFLAQIDTHPLTDRAFYLQDLAWRDILAFLELGENYDAGGP